MHNPTDRNEGRSGFVHSEFGPVATRELVTALSQLMYDGLQLFFNTKDLQWHLPGPDPRDRRLLLARQARAQLALVERLALRIRVLGLMPLRSVLSHGFTEPGSSLPGMTILGQQFQRLSEENQQLLSALREAHGLCEEYGDVATSRLLAAWIDGAESRVLHLFEVAQLEPDQAPEPPP